MSSYLKLFQDFLQKKETDVGHASPLADNEDDDDKQSSFVESIASNNSCMNKNKMEHSYIRDNTRPSSELATGLAPARTILVRRPPQCPSCHTHPLEEHDMDDSNQATMPTYNEIAAKESMNECARIAKYVKNAHSDDEDWEAHVNQMGWSNMQKTIFAKVAGILDNDQLARLANVGRQNEAMQRRVLVDKSAARMRKVFASIAWDSRLTQWLHCLLLENLPATYMGSYLDILQTMKAKLPTLMDKMLFARPMNISQELMAPVMKRQWEPLINTKVRKLTHNAVIVALPSMPTSGPVPNRLQKWYQHLATITQIVQVTLPMSSSHTLNQPLEQIAEQIVSLTRVKIQEMRNENPTRSIILIGFNAGAALALQVAISENIACVICMGFAYNTFNGVRGAPDDRILDIKIPILFVIGQNSARTSPEEIESLREKMQSETSLVVVGSADDVLRVPKSRRKIENVTQSMVDTMVVDEAYEFIMKILTNPPGPRMPTAISSVVYPKQRASLSANASGGGGDGSGGPGGKSTPLQRKRKMMDATNADGTETTPAKTKYLTHVGRPRTRPLNTSATKGSTTPVRAPQMHTSTPVQRGGKMQQKTKIASNTITNEDLNMAIQSILSDNNESNDAPSCDVHSANTNTVDNNTTSTTTTSTQRTLTNFELVAQSAKTTPVRTTLISTNSLQKSTIIGNNQNTTTTIGGTKIKVIPSNQFVHLKPPIQSQSKIYTIKTANMLNQSQHQQGSSSIGSIVTTSSPISAPNAVQSGQQQIFTLKSPNGKTTQFVTAAPATAQQKYKVVKNAAGGTTLQLTTPATSTSITAKQSTGGNVDISNIIDMPIIFADSDGNLTDTVSADGESVASQQPISIKSGGGNNGLASSSIGQLIISQKIIKEATVNGTTQPTSSTYGTIIQPTSTTTGIGAIAGGNNKPNKVVFINRNTMKPCPNIISRSTVTQQLPKYTKVVVTNPKTCATTLVPRAACVNNATTLGNTVIGASGATNIISATPIVSSVKQINLQALKSSTTVSLPSTVAVGGGGGGGGGVTRTSSGILNVNAKSFPQIQIINSNLTGSAATTATTSAASSTSQITGGNATQQIRNIVVKSSGLKQIPTHLKTQLFNRNLTVRKLVNIMPASGAGGGGTIAALQSQEQDVTSSSSSSMTTNNIGVSSVSAATSNAIQTAPKIITLNPINPSAIVVTSPATTTMPAVAQTAATTTTAVQQMKSD